MYKEDSIMENNTKRRMLTIGEAARLIDGITEYRIRQMCKTGQLRSFKAGNKFLIAENDLIEVVFGKSSVAIGGGET
ncbi:MAG: helix-turn-helix domain-containing protein [Ruminiclostridium sp.]|nr:helix-turn-helix domain-containing protein [Ruminiclostridium sp.]